MKILVTSPMRTGSTWVFDVLARLCRAERTDFVSQAGQALEIVENCRSCVLKSHSIIDIDLPVLQGKASVVRVLRNFKDSLISRALYCRNVRRSEKLENLPEEDELIDQCEGLTDQEFVNVFLSGFPLIARWLEELVVMERGEFDYTFYFEMLIHNTKDEFEKWAAHSGLSPELAASLDSVLAQCSFHRMRTVKTPGFVGSTGAGQWMRWLEPPLITSLDRLYADVRIAVRSAPALRKPVTENPGWASPKTPA